MAKIKDFGRRQEDLCFSLCFFVPLLRCDRSGETQSLEPWRSHCKSTVRIGLCPSMFYV
ncbi:hypothetical protein [Pseudanabaena sp. BC1403]|uniref:hypothetical protein n=1 Tax=Pseudanabaena sp. BC1403 TaxID=2043171 RepID=UPI0015E16A1B|nr:hypothetical protein [Pseudanabaena sp. BC1403]